MFESGSHRLLAQQCLLHIRHVCTAAATGHIQAYSLQDMLTLLMLHRHLVTAKAVGLKKRKM
jgi:hypothetical protein